MARQVQGIAKPGKSARGDVRKKRVQTSMQTARRQTAWRRGRGSG